MDELFKIFMQLDEQGQKAVLRYSRYLLNAQTAGIQAFTAEEWERLPEWLRWKIFFMVFWAAQRERLQKLFCR